MKKRIFFVLAILCMMLLTSCSPRYGMEIQFVKPDSTEIYLLLKEEKGKLIDPKSDYRKFQYYDEDGYVVAQGRLADLAGTLSVSNADRYGSSHSAISVTFHSGAEVCAFHEQYQTCKLLFYNTMTDEMDTSPELCLVPEYKFGYPKTVNYDIASKSFTVLNWQQKQVFGIPLSGMNGWWGRLLEIGVLMEGFSLIAVLVIGSSAAKHNQPKPWKLIWILAIVGALPLIGVSVITVLETAVPYFKMDTNPFKGQSLYRILVLSTPWIMYLFGVLAFHLGDRHKTKKGS